MAGQVPDKGFRLDEQEAGSNSVVEAAPRCRFGRREMIIDAGREDGESVRSRARILPRFAVVDHRARSGGGSFASSRSVCGGVALAFVTARMKLSTLSRSLEVWTVLANRAAGLVFSCLSAFIARSKACNAKSGGVFGAGGSTAGGGPSRIAAISASSAASSSRPRLEDASGSSGSSAA